MAEPLPADQFRVGDTWASPRAQHWYVVRIDQHGRALLRNVDNHNSRQYRGTRAIGRTITDAWMRIDPPEPQRKRLTMLFNVNDRVRVKLTDYGREIHYRQWQAIMPHLPYRPPTEDEEGWSKWQLWDLMSQFGPHVGLGMRLPFNAVIELQYPSTSGKG